MWQYDFGPIYMFVLNNTEVEPPTAPVLLPWKQAKVTQTRV